MSRFTRVAGLTAVALLGVGCGLVASHDGANGPRLPTERVQGDPPVSAGFEVQPEGTTPPDVAISDLDVAVGADLPLPATTDCPGTWVVLRLRSGRVLRYPPCAMPEEIGTVRHSALRAGSTTP